MGPSKEGRRNWQARFRIQQTLLCTNGTSTCEQDRRAGAWSGPGDIVAGGRDCHKSHHYALMVLASCAQGVFTS